MAPRIEITEAELLDALAQAAATDNGPPGARTLGEMQKIAGCGEKKVRALLHSLAAKGRLQHHRVMRPTLDGRMTPVAAYTVT